MRSRLTKTGTRENKQSKRLEGEHEPRLLTPPSSKIGLTENSNGLAIRPLGKDYYSTSKYNRGYCSGFLLFQGDQGIFLEAKARERENTRALSKSSVEVKASEEAKQLATRSN
jgi:hypothetical protein